MRQCLAPIVILASFNAAAPAIADERGPLCREPFVVDEMTHEITDRGYYARVDPGPVTETPTPDPTAVLCQVCVQSAADEPIGHCLAHGFEVRIMQSGFVVRDLK
jgi:hypothetical protein